MAIQSILAVGFILVSVCIAALMTRRLLLGYLGWIVANAMVVLGGVLALWFAPDWAGWLAAALFVLLVALPLALLDRARLAGQRGQWKKVERLFRWAVFLHPSSWTRVGMALARARSADEQHAYRVALVHIAATGSRAQKAMARLLLAHEERDWGNVLGLSRDRDVGVVEAKPREIRALGELGRLDEMVQTYEDAAKRLVLPSRRECMLFVFAFTGRLERVQQLLDGPLSAIDEDSKTYWIAVAGLHRDPNDEIARSMLQKLSKTANQDGVRRSAEQRLRQAGQATSLSLPLTEDSRRAVDAISTADRVELVERMQEWRKRTRKARLRAALWLFLILIVWIVLQVHFRW